MELEELLKKVREIFKNKIKIIAVIVSFIILVVFIFIALKGLKTENDSFYPEVPQSLIPLYKMFTSKNYLGLTSYVDSIIPTLTEEEKKIALFYKGEALFLENSLDEAYKIFSNINKLYKMWQADFRIGCILLIQGNSELASIHIEKFDNYKEVYYWKGRLYEAKGELDKAIDYFKKAYTNNSVFRIGKIFYQKNDYKNAIIYLTRVADIEEYREDSIKIIIQSYKALEDFENELVWINKLLSIKNDIEYTIEKGFLLHKTGKNIEAYQTLLTVMPIIKDKKVMNLFADICFDVQKYEESFNYYKESIELLDKIKYERYIESSIKSNNYKYTPEIIKNFIDKFYIEDKNEIYKLYTYLVEAYINIEEFDLGLKYAKELVNINPNSDSYIMLARVYKSMGENNEYIMALREAARINSIYNKDLINALIDMKEYDMAHSFIKEVLSKDSYNVYFLYTKARIEIKKKEIEEALKTLYKLIDIKIEDKKIKSQSLYLLGSILFYRDNYDEAIKFLKESYNIDPNIETGINLANCLIIKNNLEEAINILNQLKTIDNDTKNISRVYSLLSYAYKKANDISNFRFYLDKALELDKNNNLANKLLKEFNRK